jgi:hypothetical protein
VRQITATTIRKPYSVPVHHTQQREDKMTQTFGAVSVEEHLHGDTKWVAVRARGAEWSWLTPDDALLLAQYWMATYGASTNPQTASSRG